MDIALQKQLGYFTSSDNEQHYSRDAVECIQNEQEEYHRSKFVFKIVNWWNCDIEPTSLLANH